MGHAKYLVNNQNKTMTTKRKPITNMYQVFQFLNKGALSFSCSTITYLFDDLNEPVKTINKPNAIPMSMPILILRMAKPNSNPNTIAKIKASSPLLVSGFRSLI
jgi:hypothetical protein